MNEAVLSSDFYSNLSMRRNDNYLNELDYFMKGKLIVVDGIDGVGKVTQTKLLYERLKKERYKAAILDFPQYYNNFFGKLIGRFQNGEFGDAPTASPYLASVLYTADRWKSK